MVEKEKKDILFNVRITKTEKERIDKFIEYYKSKYNITLTMTQVLRKGVIDLLDASMID